MNIFIEFLSQEFYKLLLIKKRKKNIFFKDFIHMFIQPKISQNVEMKCLLIFCKNELSIIFSINYKNVCFQ